MKKKNIVMAIIGIIVLVCFIVGVSIVLLLHPETNETIPKEKNEISLNTDRKIQICKDRSTCPILYEDIYGTIETNIQNKAVLKKIETLNQKIDQYHHEINQSHMTDSVCQEVKDIYQHRSHVVSEYYLYASQDIVSIALFSYREDLCLNTKEYLPVEIFVYDLKANRELSKKEIQEREGISDEVIQGAISSNIDHFNQSMNLNISSGEVLAINPDPVLFYNVDGEVFSWYYIPYFNKYYPVAMSDLVS